MQSLYRRTEVELPTIWSAMTSIRWQVERLTYAAEWACLAGEVRRRYDGSGAGRLVTAETDGHAGLRGSDFRACRSEACEPRLQPLFDIRLAVVYVRPGCQFSASDVLGSVRKRPVPGAQSLTAWICGRLQAADLAPPLSEQLTNALDPSTDLPRSVASYSRICSSHGTLKAHDWQSVARLTVWHSTSRGRATGPAGLSLAGLTRDTATRHARRYLSMSLSGALALAGWEWILERALRVARRGRRIPYVVESPGGGQCAFTSSLPGLS